MINFLIENIYLNLQAVFDLVLDMAIAAKLPSQEMLKTIYVISDMKFAECGGKQYETDFPLIQQKFVRAGYELPGNLQHLKLLALNKYKNFLT